MTTRRRLRIARRRAASALLAYIDDGTPASERALIDATHALEAVSVRRRLERVSQRARAAQLARLAASR